MSRATFGGACLIAALVVTFGPSRGARAAECLLADAEEAILFEASDGGFVCPLEKHRRVERLSTIRPVYGAVLACGKRTVCGREMQVIRLGSREFIAEPGGFAIVEQAWERDDVPAIEIPPRDGCIGLLVGQRGADMFVLERADGPKSRVTSLARLAPGLVLAGCARYGGLVLATDGQRTGLIIASDLDGACGPLPAAYLQHPGETCRSYAWTGKVNRTTWVWPGRGVNPDPNLDLLVAEDVVRIDGIYRGEARSQRAWYQVAAMERVGYVPAERIDLTSLDDARLPQHPFVACPPDVRIATVRGALTLREPEILDALDGGQAPRSISLAESSRVPLFESPAGVRVWHLGYSWKAEGRRGILTEIPDYGDDGDTSQKLDLRSNVLRNCETTPRNRGAVLTQIAGLEQAFDRGWTKGITPSMREILDSIAAGTWSEEDVTSRLPLPIVTAAGLAALADRGVAQRVLRATIAGSEGAESSLEVLIAGAIRAIRQRPSCDSVSTSPPPAAALQTAPPSLGAATAVLRSGHPATARELFLDVLAEPGLHPAVFDLALAGYQEASLLSTSTPRAAEVLREPCRSGNERACWLGTAASLDAGDLDGARRSGDRLREAPDLDARSLATLATLERALDRSYQAAVLFARALERAGRGCDRPNSMLEVLSRQFVRAAVDAGEPEVARDVLSFVPLNDSDDDTELGVTVALASGHVEEALGLLIKNDWGLRTGRINARILLSAGYTYDSLCMFDHANSVRGVLTQVVSQLEAVTKRLEPSLSGGRRSYELIDAVDAAIGTFPAHIARQARALFALDGSNACTEASSLQREHDDLAQGSASDLDERARATLQRALGAAEDRCSAWFRRRAASFGDDVRSLRVATDELEIDRLDAVKREMESSMSIAGRMQRLASDQFYQDVAEYRRGNLPQLPHLLKHVAIGFEPDRRARQAAASLGVELQVCTADGNRKVERNWRCGSALLDDHIGSALACIEAKTAAWVARPEVIADIPADALARYLPAVRMVRPHNLANAGKSLPDELKDVLVQIADENDEMNPSCCASAHAGLARLVVLP